MQILDPDCYYLVSRTTTTSTAATFALRKTDYSYLYIGLMIIVALIFTFPDVPLYRGKFFSNNLLVTKVNFCYSWLYVVHCPLVVYTLCAILNSLFETGVPLMTIRGKV